ncbi:MAG: DUF6152 family protein [Pseudomonadota bacterium]
MKRRTAAVIVALGAAFPALAHHSFAMFDQAKTLTLTGTVKEFQWTNPHIFVQLMVKDMNSEKEWSIEFISVSSARRLGWRRDVIKPGDKVIVDLHPLRDGSPGGSLLAMVMPSGEVMGQRPASAGVTAAPK